MNVRSKQATAILLALVSLMLLGAGCGPQGSVNTNTTGTGTGATPTQGTSVATSDACGNPYYPFKAGMAITYHETSSAGSSATSDYTIRTVSVAGTTATIRAELENGATADMSADCASGSVALKGSSGLGAAVEGVTFKTTVVSSSGTFMPSDVKAGTTWSNSETIRMDMTGGAAASLGPITLTTKEESKAIGEESVTVPAGTFKAMKVELKRTSTSVAKIGKIPASTETSTEWWVKGIGMVKTVTKGQEGTSTIEAKTVTGQ